jgi:hypothetical protein
MMQLIMLNDDIAPALESDDRWLLQIDLTCREKFDAHHFVFNFAWLLCVCPEPVLANDDRF